MHQILFKIGDFPIYTYGPIMAVGFLLSFFFAFHIAKLRNEDLEFYMDLYLFMIIIGLLGSKVLYNIIEYKEFLEQPLKMMNCRNGGLVWYGGVIGCVIFIAFYSRYKKIPFFQITDTLAPPLALGLGIGRIGCLMGGCCYGKACDLPWAITYPPGANPVAGIPVHPSPVYETLASFAIALVIYIAIRRSARMGVATALWFTLYPIVRFMLEFLRGDEVRGFLIESDAINISTSQFLSLLMLLVAGGIWAYVYKTEPGKIVTAADRAAMKQGKGDSAKDDKDGPAKDKSGKKKADKKKSGGKSKKKSAADNSNGGA